MRILLNNGHHNTGLWITRHLGAAGHQVLVADYRSLAFGFKSRYACAFEWLPEPNDPAYVDSLLALVRRLRPDVLLPIVGLAAISARRDELECETAVLAPEAEAYQTLADKANVYNLCGQLGIPHPRVLGTDPESVAVQLGDRDADIPLAVIKPRRDFGAGNGLVFLYQRKSLADLWHGLVEQYGPLIATEFIPGPVDAQYAVQLLFDRDSELIEFFVLRKLRQWPARSGITVAATSTHELALVTQMLPLFRKLRWCGPVEVELKRDPRTGNACVLEINPRFSGTVAFPLSAGVDLPGAMLRASLGQSSHRPLQPYYAAGLHYWNPWPYTRSVLSDLCHPGRIGQGLRGLTMPLTGHPVGNPYVLSDPAALIGKVLSQVTEALRRRRSGSEREIQQ